MCYHFSISVLVELQPYLFQKKDIFGHVISFVREIWIVLIFLEFFYWDLSFSWVFLWKKGKKGELELVLGERNKKWSCSTKAGLILCVRILLRQHQRRLHHQNKMKRSGQPTNERTACSLHPNASTNEKPRRWTGRRILNSFREIQIIHNYQHYSTWNYNSSFRTLNFYIPRLIQISD